MKKFCRLLSVLLFAFAFIGTRSVVASHISGGDITYQYIGQDSFLVTLSLFRDCDGIVMDHSEMVTFTSTCGGSFTAILPNVPNPTTGNTYSNISQLCSQDSLNSTCFNGSLPGMQEYTYEAIVLITPSCNTWIMSWRACCRNETVNVPSSSNDDVYIEATLNSATNNGNNSPVFTAQPIPYVCVNQPVSYNYGITESDGDSLVYSIIPGKESSTLDLIYGGGYSGNIPIPGMTIDPQTGQLNFMATTLGNFIVVVLVKEYDTHGNLLGTVMRDIQFVVQYCTNDITPPASTIGNLTGNGSQIGPRAVQLCEGSGICFDLIFTDPNPTDSLSFQSNLSVVLPGATMTVTGVNPATVSICWQAVPNSPSFNSFSLDVSDNACPISGIGSTTIEVHVIPSTYAGPDQTICGNQEASVNATGGALFNWNVLSGPPMEIGTNFSCNPCSNPVATPTETTTYLVASDLNSSCVSTDTITVYVVPDFTWNLTQNAPFACLSENVYLACIPAPGGNYTYNWSPSVGLSDPTVYNPVFTATTPGINTFHVSITSPQGCVKNDFLSINVAPKYSPQVTAMLSDSLINCGDTLGLYAVLEPTLPDACGLALAPCQGLPRQLTIGTGTFTNSPTSYPAPYGNFYNGARHQMLFLASELQAMGISGGQFTALAFDVATVSGLTEYANFEVKMGCTGQTQLTSWETGTVAVAPAALHNVITGWNEHIFSDGFNWDGISNIIVEVCFDQRGISTWTNNSQTRYSSTPFNSTLQFNSDVGGVCYGGTHVQSSNRPNIRFTFCDVATPPGTYGFDWAPSTEIDNPHTDTTFALPYNNATYQVVVTDHADGCTDTATVAVNVNCNDCFAPIPEIHEPLCSGDSNGWVVAHPVIANQTVVMHWYDSNNILLQTSPLTLAGDTLLNIPAGVYTIQITDPILNCHADTVIVVGEPTPVTVNAGTDSIICTNGTAVLTATGNGGQGAPYMYAWNQGLTGSGPHTVTPVSNTCYRVTATDANGCISFEDEVCIELFLPLNGSVFGDDTICAGEHTTISALATGGSGTGYLYTWTDAEGNMAGTGSSVTIFPTATTTQYCVTITDDCETPPVTECLEIHRRPAPTVSLTADTTAGCSPVSVHFTNTTAIHEVGTVLWEFGHAGATGTETITTSYTYNTPGCYDLTLTVTSPEGCVGDTTLYDMVCVYNDPVAQFTFGPQSATLLYNQINFNNLSIGNAVNLWDFNNGAAFSDLEHPSFTFPGDQLGYYPVTLTVTNAYGCSHSVTQTVIIDKSQMIYIPNSFTPNGDGMNDIFIPTGEGFDLSNYELFIFDGWGNHIFYTADTGIGWDGSKLNSTQQAQAGVYVWYLRKKHFYQAAEYENFGYVTLMR